MTVRRRRLGDLLLIELAPPGLTPRARTELRGLANLREIVMNDRLCRMWTDAGGASSVITVLRDSGMDVAVVRLHWRAYTEPVRLALPALPALPAPPALLALPAPPALPELPERSARRPPEITIGTPPSLLTRPAHTGSGLAAVRRLPATGVLTRLIILSGAPVTVGAR